MQNTTTDHNKEIAATILKQLGGGRFLAMTGAKNLGFYGPALTFNLGRNASKANRVEISLEANDTYTMRFGQFRKMELKSIKKIEGVYCDTLQKNFTDVTGMYTSL